MLFGRTNPISLGCDRIPFGTGPRFIKIGRAVRYAMSAVREFILSRQRLSTYEFRYAARMSCVASKQPLAKHKSERQPSSNSPNARWWPRSGLIARDLWNGLLRLCILVLYNGAWVLSSRADEYRKNAADEYRKNAEECRRQAARSKHADDRERWLRVAQHFQQLAREAEIEQPQQS
jgi:hypothetical protein